MPIDHDPYAALRLADYRRVLAGSVLANLGTGLQAAAVEWELYERTRDPFMLGLVGLVLFLPVLLLSLPAGQAADHFSRKRLLMCAQGVSTAASLGLAALSWFEGPVPLVFACLAVVGTARAFGAPARWALVPQVVPAHLIPNAVTWNSSGFQIASVAGPALAGLIVATVGPAAGYLVTAGCALTCAVLVLTVRPHQPARPPEGRSLETLLAGVRFVWRTKPILATITLDLFAVLLGGATVLLPIFARDILLVGPEEYGWLRAAPSLGALVMGLALAHRAPFRRPGLALLSAVAGFGIATIVFGLSENFWLSLAMLALTGALDNVSVVVRGTLVQTLTPDAMRGRVSAVNAIFIGSSNELGAFESGVTATWFGAVASVVIGGAGTLGVVLAVMLRWPEVLRLGPLRAAVAPEGPVAEAVGEAEQRETA